MCSDARGAHLRRLRGEEQNSSIPGASRGGCAGSGVWAGSAGPSGYHDETSNTTPTALYRRWGRRHLRERRNLPFSARATFHPDCTVGTGFSPVRPLLRAGVSSGVLASCADAKIRTIFACLRERFAGCDRRFGISPTPEHDVDIDYATAHAAGLICFLWDNFRDKMTFYDCVLGASSRPATQFPAAVTRRAASELDPSFFGDDLSRFHNGEERQTDQRVTGTSRGSFKTH